jgi:flavin-dependent dehydrogenase
VRHEVRGNGSSDGAAGFDAIVVGGGPGGSVLASRLRQLGRSVLVLEKQRFPRFHLGESLLPGSMGALVTIGAFDAVLDRFLVKRGANFHEDGTGRMARFDFRDAFDATHHHAFEVPRDEFDELLLRHAGALGADVREGWTVSRIRFEGGRAVGVDARDPGGKEHAIAAGVVVDATGRDALLAHTHQTTERIQGLDKTALYSHWRGAWRDEGERAGDIQIVVFAPGWFWFIPFKDGRTSVGAVVSSAWVKARGPAETVDALYQRAIGESKAAARMLEGAEQLWPGQAAADFSFRVRELSGDGWLAVGDAGGFIDPLFSTGAHIAMDGGVHAAEAIDEALRAGDVSRARFAPWERRVRLGADLFLQMVLAFYEGALPPLLFADKSHPFLRRAITSMLSGHVYDEDARWVREVRARFGRDGGPRF